MNERKYSVLFLGKKDDEHVERALQFCRLSFSHVEAHLGGWGEPLPEDIGSWQGEFVISYLSRWVVPETLLSRAGIAAINFHPASPAYPGIGCNNFALYDEASEYGVTCHHMASRVDTGSIIAVKRFPLLASDSVASLLARTYDYQLALFYEIAGLIVEGKPLPVSDEKWTRKPYSRKEFNELGRILPGMSKEEVAKRVRATSFGRWQPAIDLHGFVFELRTEQGG